MSPGRKVLCAKPTTISKANALLGVLLAPETYTPNPLDESGPSLQLPRLMRSRPVPKLRIPQMANVDQTTAVFYATQIARYTRYACKLLYKTPG
jgi:hypothetical protein